MTIFYAISLLVFGAGLISTAPLAVAVPAMLVAAALHTLVFYRYGLVAGTVSMGLMEWNLPLALDPGNWTFSTTSMLVLVLVAIPVLAFHAALGGRSPFGDPAT